MAVTGLTSFEARSDSVDSGLIVGTASYSTTTMRTGAASLRCNPASGASGYWSHGTGANGSYIHFALNVATLPSVTRLLVNTIAASTLNVRLTSSGTLGVYNDTTLIGTSSAAFASPGWHWVGVRQLTGTSVVFLQIDGINEVTGTATVTAVNATIGARGTEASAVDLFIDDVIFDNAGFLAPSKVDLALPISDNTRTGVTGGAGGTTNLWDAVNNTPPAGVASASETDLTNIRYPASTTEDYIANLETYTTLGIATGDTVLAVRSIVRHGEDIATGTKTMQNCGALTNPTVAGIAETFGADAGAHLAETGNWINTFGTLTTSPSVTLGTSPTIRASRVAEARVGCIDFMAMAVAWTPATGTTVTPGTLALTTAAFAPTVTTTANQTVVPGVAALVLTTFAPTVTASDHQTVTPGTASLTLATFAPSVTVGVSVVPATASLTLTGLAPTVTATANQTVTPDTAPLALAAFAPTVTASDHQTVVPATASLTTAAFAPTVTASDHQTVVPDVAALTLATFAPTVTTGANQTVTPGTLGLSLTAFAPDVTASDHKVATPGTAALSLTGFAPTVTATTGVLVTPGPLGLTLTGYAPTVTGSDVPGSGGPRGPGAQPDADEAYLLLI